MKTVSVLNNIFDTSQAIRAKVASELTHSWPLPKRPKNDSPQVMAFYFAMHLPPPQKEFQVYPPNWLAVLDANTGAVITLEKKTALFYGCDTPFDKPFGNFRFTHPFDGDLLQQKVEHFNKTYTQFLTAWFADERAAPENLAEDFRRDFDWFIPKPTHRFYRQLAPQFMEWCGIKE